MSQSRRFLFFCVAAAKNAAAAAKNNHPVNYSAFPFFSFFAKTNEAQQLI